MPYLVYTLPFVIPAFLFIRKYEGSLSGKFQGSGMLRFLALVYWLLFLVVLLAGGASWFCGECTARNSLNYFIFPAFGCAMVMFPQVFVGSSGFQVGMEKAKEFFVSFGGLAAILYGHYPLFKIIS